MFTMGMLENTFSIFCSVVTSGYITYTSWKCRDTVCDTILGAGLFFFFLLQFVMSDIMGGRSVFR